MTGLRKPISDEQLNAYVDGELAPGESAVVAKAIAQDPELAGKAAALSALRAQLRAEMAVPELELPELPEKPSGGGNRWCLGGAAAAVALFLLAGVLAFGEWGAKSRVAFVDHLRQAHGEDLRPRADGMVVAARAFPGFLPDLTASKLRAVGTDSLKIGLKPVDRVLYVGTRGCRVSLFQFQADPETEEALIAAHEGERLAYLWRIGSHGYALLATGMGQERFQLIAETVRETTLKQLQPDRRTRIALAQNRKASLPCSHV